MRVCSVLVEIGAITNCLLTETPNKRQAATSADVSIRHWELAFWLQRR